MKPYQIFLAFALFWPFLQWWMLAIDPELLTRAADSPEYVRFDLWRDATMYGLWFGLLWTIQRGVPFSNLRGKCLILLLQSWVFMALVDLFIGGNFLTGTVWDFRDFALIGAGSLYVLITWWMFWRKPPESDPIEPGKVYLVTRPPRNWLEFIGTVIMPGRAGPVGYLVYNEGSAFWYGYVNGKYGFEYIPKVKIDRNQTFTKIMLPWGLEFGQIWRQSGVHDTKWTLRRNCFWMKRTIERAMK